ncbi:MAG: hypothetical protein ACREIA_26655 [Opitutaceae bacterium]
MSGSISILRRSPEVDCDLAGVGMRVSAEMAADFGVFFTRPAADRQACVAVEHFVQKPPADEIRAQEREGLEFWVDTGLWFLGAKALARLAADCGWDETSQRVTQRTRDGNTGRNESGAEADQVLFPCTKRSLC